MTFQYGQDNITPAESTRHSWDLEKDREAREHDIRVREMELLYMKQQNRWENLFRVPVAIVRLPIHGLMALGYIAAMLRGKDVSEEFWQFLEK